MSGIVVGAASSERGFSSPLDEQREFINMYQQQVLDGHNFSHEEIEEMESVLFSVSYGKQVTHKKANYQAFSAAISNQQHVELVLQYINRKEKVKQARSKVVAYRVNLPDGVNEEDPESDIQSDNGQPNMLLAEGFEDGGIEGCGQKLLHLLQKMGVENIMIVVCIWHHQSIGFFSSETFKCTLERAKELLTTLHVKVLEAEKINQQEEQRVVQYIPAAQKKQQQLLYNQQHPTNSGVRATMHSSNQLPTTVYSTHIIPDYAANTASLSKKNYRPNNFMAGVEQVHRNDESDDEDEQLEIELTEDEFNFAVKMTEHAIRKLTKAHIIELRNQIKPHPLVERVLSMVCILRGCIAPNWTVARDMMNSMTFKMELMLMDVCNIKQSLIKKVVKTLNQHQKQLTPDNVSLVSEGASILLTWIINLVKWNAGHTRYKFDENTMGGTKLLNNQMLPVQAEDNEDEAQQKKYIREHNAFGLKQKEQEETFGTGQQEQTMTHENAVHGAQTTKVRGQIEGQSSMRKGNLTTKSPKKLIQKQGVYLPSKQMVFSDSKVLAPTKDSTGKPLKTHHDRFSSEQQTRLSPGVQHHQAYPSQHLEDQQINEEDYDQNEKQLNNLVQLLEENKELTLDDIKSIIPENDEEILRFLDAAALEDQPTEILVQLAGKLKGRREKIFDEQ